MGCLNCLFGAGRAVVQARRDGQFRGQPQRRGKGKRKSVALTEKYINRDVSAESSTRSPRVMHLDHSHTWAIGTCLQRNCATESETHK